MSFCLYGQFFAGLTADHISDIYSARLQNALLETEQRAALGCTSPCRPVLPSNPFPVGHSVAEPGNRPSTNIKLALILHTHTHTVQSSNDLRGMARASPILWDHTYMTCGECSKKLKFCHCIWNGAWPNADLLNEDKYMA